jgi:hypothetical protein
MSNYSDTVSDKQLTRDRHETDTPLTGTRHAPDNKQELQEGKEGKELEEGTESAKTPPSVPPEISGLALYEGDEKLCRRWPTLLPEWKKAYPGVDVLAEVRKAHAWELANPNRIKKDRPRFLNTWLSRAQDQPRQPAPVSRIDTDGKVKCLNCGGTGKVSGGVGQDGAVVLVACQVCQRKRMAQ